MRVALLRTLPAEHALTVSRISGEVSAASPATCSAGA